MADRFLLDGMHAKSHKCSKARFHPSHSKNYRFAKGKGNNTQAGEQLWSRMDKLQFCTSMSRRILTLIVTHVLV